MSVVKSRIRMQNLTTKKVDFTIDFEKKNNNFYSHTATVENCGFDKDGLRCAGKFVLYDDDTTISVCHANGKLYVTDGISVSVVDASGNRKNLLSTTAFQGSDSRLYGDSLRKKVLFNATHGVFFTDGTSGNTDSKLFGKHLDCLAFVEDRVVGSSGSIVYVSDINATTLNPGNESDSSAFTFDVGSQVTALCGLNNDLYIFAGGDMYRVDVANFPSDCKFSKTAEHVGTVRHALFYKNKMYCFCNEGVRIVDGNTVKQLSLPGKEYAVTICPPVVLQGKIVFADQKDVVFFDGGNEIEVICQSVQDMAVVDDVLYAVVGTKLYKYQPTDFADDCRWISSPIDFGIVTNKSLRKAVLSGNGEVQLVVKCDGVVCGVIYAILVKNKRLCLSCYGSGKTFVAELKLSEDSNVTSLTFLGSQVV